MAHAHYLAPDDKDSLWSEIAEVVQYPDAWLETPNDQLNGRAPRDLMDSEKGRDILFNLVHEIKHGMVT